MTSPVRRAVAVLVCLAGGWSCLAAETAGAPVFSELKSADGTRTLKARPVDVVSAKDGLLRFDREQGGTVDVAVGSFAPGHREELSKWAAAVEADARRALSRRLQKKAEVSVLFVGNSYSFDVPKEFARVARSEGRKARVEQVTFGGWPLSKHAENPETLKKIREGKWDVVVLQEQSQVPSFPARQRDEMMLPAVRTLAKAVREAGAEPVLYRSWGRRDGDRENARQFPNDDFAAMQRRLDEGFDAACEAAGGMIGAPVGQAWAVRMSEGRGRELYAADGSHPSAQGTHLAAAVFYATLFDQKPARGAAAETALDGLAFEVARWKAPAFPLAEAKSK